MLKIAVEHPTKETGLFVRDFSDVEIVSKMSLLPRDMLLVEKTPSHLLKLDRIRKLFPRSKIILIRRDRLDVIYSMLQANSFWKESPRSLVDAVNLYKRFAEAEAAFGDYDYVLEYEALVENTVDEVHDLYEFLGLKTDCTAEIVEKTKCGRALPPELKGVFRTGVPGEGLKNFKPAELDFIQSELGTLAEKPRKSTSKTAVKKPERMRVLLTNHLLRSYTGSEVFTYTIADFLRRKGIDVVAYSKYVGGIREDFQMIDVPVVEDLEQIRGERFDVTHVHHNINALEVRHYFPDLPIVFLSHGVLPFLEQPPCIDIGVSKFLAVSEEVKENLTKKDVKEDDIEIFRNIVDSGKFCPTSAISPKPRKALILSYKIDVEKENTIREACDKLGIDCKFVGGRFGQVPQDLLPQYTNDADIVFSLGRGAIESMLCGRVPVVFDYLGGDGLVMPANVAEIMKCNFSGRRYGVHYTVDQLVGEIQKYKREYGDELREIALKWFDAERRIGTLIQVYDRHKNDRVNELNDMQKDQLNAFIESISETRKLTRDHFGDEFQRRFDQLTSSVHQPDRPQQDMLEAESLIEQAQYERARDILNRVLRAEPNRVDALNNLAAIETLVGRFGEALAILKRILKIDPRNEVARRNLEYLRQQISTASVRPGVAAEQTDVSRQTGTDPNPVRLISFYLPQFHPIPENGKWWGEGFTDWRNVAKTKPLFLNHYQPHVPGELGFYDLRLPETRKAQADLARQYGIEGFCYWHYWFNGKLLLERPFNEVLESDEPHFPFCLAWANENWTRRWDGRESEVLQEQVYGGEEDDRSHFEWLLKAFKDPRYIRVDNKPLFLVYNPGRVPNPCATISVWRELAASAGLPGLFLIAIKSHRESRRCDWLSRGFDAELAFQPDWVKLARFAAPRDHQSNNGRNGSVVVAYEDVWPILASGALNSDNHFCCVMPGWDNTPRRDKGGATVLKEASPEAYEKWLKIEIGRAARRAPSRRIAFINAWNEWAEGNHLEPDLKFGRAYLEATRRALSRVPSDREMSELLAELATAAARTGFTEDAECDFESALRYHPDAITTRRSYASLLQSVGKVDEAIDQLEQVLEIDGDNAQVHNDLGVLYCQQEEHDKAADCLRESLRLDENNVATMKNLGIVYLTSGRTRDAMKLYQGILSQNPRDAEVLLLMGNICHKVGRTEKARFFYEKVLEIEPGSEPARQSLEKLRDRGPNASVVGVTDVSAQLSSSQCYRNDGAVLATGDGETGLSIHKLTSYQDYKEFMTQMQVEYAARRQHERSLIVNSDSFTVRGYCYPCKLTVDFLVDYQLATMVNGVLTPHWRERLVCPVCGLSARRRACVHLFEYLLGPDRESSIYISEQMGPVYQWLAGAYPKVIGSEYLGKSVPFGEGDEHGIRNETLTGLTFEDDQFDYVLSFDVFEHIADFRQAFRECRRVVKPGGSLLFTVPFALHFEKNLALAFKKGADEIVHLSRPIRHGDPLNSNGCVAFHHFGWELLGQLREIGFADVSAHLCWSKELGYMGRGQVVFIAEKGKKGSADPADNSQAGRMRANTSSGP